MVLRTGPAIAKRVRYVVCASDSTSLANQIRDVIRVRNLVDHPAHLGNELIVVEDSPAPRGSADMMSVDVMGRRSASPSFSPFLATPPPAAPVLAAPPPAAPVLAAPPPAAPVPPAPTFPTWIPFPAGLGRQQQPESQAIFMVSVPVACPRGPAERNPAPEPSAVRCGSRFGDFGSVRP